MSTRRTNAVNGYVAFPVDDPAYPSSGEGGMFVRLVVIDPSSAPLGSWRRCCGGDNFIVYDGTYQRDDRRERPKLSLDACGSEDLYAFDAFHFPRLDDPNTHADDFRRFVSRPYLCAMTLGSTGWSGCNDEGYWHCTYEMLTPDGKQLYDMIQKLYPGCDLYLQTWLDT